MGNKTVSEEYKGYAGGDQGSKSFNNMFGLQDKVIKVDLVQTRVNENGETVRVVKIRKKKKEK